MPADITHYLLVGFIALLLVGGIAAGAWDSHVQRAARRRRYVRRVR